MKMQHQLLERCDSFLRAQSQPKFEPRKTPTRAVTISREAGAGGVTIGRLVAEHLEARTAAPAGSWGVFDRNLVGRVLQDHGLHEKIDVYMPEDSISSIRDAFEELLGLHPSSWTLHHHTQFTILKLATLGNSIIVGRGGNFIAGHLRHVLHVRLVAPLERRIKHAAAFYQLTHEEAAQYVRRTDRARSRYVREHFHASVADPLHYHLVVNTGRLSYEKVARIITDVVLDLDIPAAPDHKAAPIRATPLSTSRIPSTRDA